jgi:hypothetical protein
MMSYMLCFVTLTASQLIILESLRLLDHVLRGVGDQVTFVITLCPTYQYFVIVSGLVKVGTDLKKV